MINIENYLRLDLTDMILVLISTLLICFIAKKYFWSYLKDYLDKRQALISQELNDAKMKEEESKALLEKASKELEQSKARAEELMAKVEQDATKRSIEILDDAKAKAKDEKEKMLLEVDKMKKDMVADMRDEMTNIAFSVAKKLLEKEIDEDVQEKYVSELIKKAGNR